MFSWRWWKRHQIKKIDRAIAKLEKQITELENKVKELKEARERLMNTEPVDTII